MSYTALHHPAEIVPVTSRSLALWSLSLATPGPVTAACLVARADILGIEAASMRVALGRLMREKMALQVARGVYALGPSAAALHTKARGWDRIAARTRPWTGKWTVALVDHLGRTDRARRQRREKALRLTGFAPSSAGAWVRPDNLRDDLDTMIAGLRGLGLDDDAMVFGACTASVTDATTFRSLWQREAIEAGYRRWIDALARSACGIGGSPLREAARESLMLGQSVIRAINADPLLPPEMVDTGLRAEMVEAMVAYDATGRDLWKQIDQAALLPTPETMESIA